jgi:hypothetical protein
MLKKKWKPSSLVVVVVVVVAVAVLSSSSLCVLDVVCLLGVVQEG